MNLQFDTQEVDVVSPIIVAIESGNYEQARELINSIEDSTLRDRVRTTVATRTQIYL